MSGIQLGVRNSSYEIIPDSEDVSPTESTIDNRSRRGFKSIAMIGGLVIVIIVFLSLSFFFSINYFLPPIVVYQTSLLNGVDKLNNIDRATMTSRGFDVGLLSFGNTECNKLLKVIHDVEQQKCNIPAIEDTASVTINNQVQYQTILGFGGAFTEAASINFYKLPEIVQDKVLELYFSKDNGINYRMGRVPINSCDFSPKSYSFDEIAFDYELQFFDTELTHDAIYP